MKVRIGLVLVTAAVISGTGCASGGGGPASGSGETVTTPSGEVLPPGIRPRDNNHTNSAELYLAQAASETDEAEREERFQQALEAAREGIAADPENAKSYFQAAQAHVGLGNWGEAADMFDRAEEIYPRYILETEPWREQGWVGAYNAAIEPLNAGNLEEAAELFEAANDLYGERPEAYLQLGSIYSRLNWVEEAAEAFRDAMSILEETRETQLADTAAADAWMQHWDIATMGLGQALMFSQQYEEAAELYGGLLEEDPENVTIMSNLAGVLSELGQADSVQALYDELLSRPDLTERDYFNAGVGLYQIENWERAAEAFSAAAEMNSFNRDARLNQAQTYMIAEEYEMAIPACESLLELDPRSQEGWTFMARAFAELGNQEEAGRVIQQYQDLGYHVANIRLQGLPDGGAQITGEVVNFAAEPGQTITLRFFFGGPDGQEIGSTEVRVQMPAVEESAAFSGTLQSSEMVSGYRYEVVEG